MKCDGTQLKEEQICAWRLPVASFSDRFSLEAEIPWTADS